MRGTSFKVNDTSSVKVTKRQTKPCHRCWVHGKMEKKIRMEKKLKSDLCLEPSSGKCLIYWNIRGFFDALNLCREHFFFLTASVFLCLKGYIASRCSASPRSPLTFHPPMFPSSFFPQYLHTRSSVIPFPSFLWADKSSAGWQKLQWLIRTTSARERDTGRDRERERGEVKWVTAVVNTKAAPRWSQTETEKEKQTASETEVKFVVSFWHRVKMIMCVSRCWRADGWGRESRSPRRPGQEGAWLTDLPLTDFHSDCPLTYLCGSISDTCSFSELYEGHHRPLTANVFDVLAPQGWAEELSRQYVWLFASSNIQPQWRRSLFFKCHNCSDADCSRLQVNSHESMTSEKVR